MMRSRVLTGLAVVAAVAAGGVGGALIGVPGLSGAQQFPKDAATTTATGSTSSPKIGRGGLRDSALLDAAAKALGLTTKQLTDKLSDGKTTIADVAKQQKVDVNKVIDAMASADRDRISSIVNTPWPKFGGPGAGPGGPGMSPGGPAVRGGGPLGGLGLGFGRFGAVALDPVAKALGITTDELQADLAKGQTIAQIAKAKNVDVNGLIDTLVADASAKIDQAVTDGHLKAGEATKIKAALKSGITDIVNNGFPKGPMGGGFAGPGHRGFGGQTPGSKPATS